MTQPSPSATAEVTRRLGSDPASGSVSANDATTSPEASRGGHHLAPDEVPQHLDQFVELGRAHHEPSLGSGQPPVQRGYAPCVTLGRTWMILPKWEGTRCLPQDRAAVRSSPPSPSPPHSPPAPHHANPSPQRSAS